MQKKFGFAGVLILFVILVITATGNIQLLPDLITEKQIVGDAQSQSASRLQPHIAKAEEQPVKEYTLIIEQTDIQISDTAVWHAWTYNGTVPTPTLMVNQEDLLRIRVINNHDLTHSFHAHMSDYDPKHDGSPVNIITGVGAGSMIPPGGEWT
ncbi:MAG: multicopper oxidase domain-containing protein [Nitrosopumilus sp.]|nr:multicopper oxidase domain-containing protein [Nitrosopumilus sp.]